MLRDVFLILAGAVVLIGGGEALVRGAAALARLLGVSATVVGLTVVAIGTSMPELVVSVMAAATGKAALCAGNIVGSNILNVLLILGATAAIYPIRATAAFIKREIPIMIGVSALFFWMAADGRLGRREAAALMVLLGGYNCFAVWLGRREQSTLAREYEDVQPAPMKRSAALYLALIVAGLGLLAVGSRLFLSGAVSVATAFGVSEAVIGLTLVALGTSFPELATCLVAAYRGHPDICLGNIIGSNVYNILAIAGLSGLVYPLPFEAGMIRVHMPVMVASAVVLWPMAARGRRVSRSEGCMLLLFYVAFMTWTLATQG